MNCVDDFLTLYRAKRPSFNMMLLPLTNALRGLESLLPYTLQAIILLTGSLFLWRLWKFTILPLLEPNQPKRLPYWIPYSEATLAYARRYFGNTREPFILTVAGQKFYIIMSPKDMSTVYKNVTTLTFDGFIRDLYTTFGMSKEGIRLMWQIPPSNQKMAQILQRVHKLTSGRQSFTWDAIPNCSVSAEAEKNKVVSLYGWCAAVLGNATIRALFGDVLLDLEPRLLDYFAIFDEESWKLTFQLPPLLAGRMHAAKDESRKAYIRFFELPSEKRSGACHYIRSVEAKQRQAGMTDRDIGIAAQMFFWGANANPSKVCFWLLSHMMYNPELLQGIRKEIAPSITKDNKFDMQSLLENSPLLEAAFNETLRVTSVNSSARNIEVPVVVGGKTLQIDGKIMMPYRQLHIDETIFGPDTKVFNVDRFLKSKDLSRSPSFKPFGGGSTYCSGRFIARRQVFAFVALAVHLYELRLQDPNTAFPRMDETKPTLGIMDMMKGDNVMLIVSPRSCT
ncbi:hypothetical protein G7Y79_00002g007630 [Physcia stellaris]|nr:hypothetical protein G7Y79_00002g007630 [Physcia stellaris]